MTAAFRGLADLIDPIAAAPQVELTLAPGSPEQAARVLDVASERGMRVLLWGGGSHQGMGGRVDADLIVSTERLGQIVDWQPDDLTLVVEAGVPVVRIEQELASLGQTAVLPETGGSGTIGGVVAGGLSGWRRLRYGPTRDRMLEVVLVTGDGRLVRGGGRVVKNVTGYDLPRLVTGSFGALGLIAQVCIKLWPLPESVATVWLEDPERASLAYRPLAVVEELDGTRVFLAGHQPDVESQAAALGGRMSLNLEWPSPLADPVVLALRFPPRLEHEARSRVPTGWHYQVERRVGQIRLGTDPSGLPDGDDLRGWAESVGGSLILLEAPDHVYETFDPWGAEPASMEIQRRLVARFDPARVLNRGRLPGGL